MADKRIDVMISSTSKDLAEHRKEARDAIWRTRMYPLMMENLRATDAASASLQLVDDADIYIGIIGMRYGYIPDDPRNPDKISIVEMEYRRAVERAIPRLIFMMSDNHPITADKIDDDPISIQKLKAFKNELTRNHVVAFFESPEDLKNLVIQALARYQNKSQPIKSSSRSRDIRVNIESMEKMISIFRQSEQELEEIQNEINQIASQLEEDALLGLAGASFVDALRGTLNNQIVQQSEKYQELANDLRNYLDQLRADDPNNANFSV